MCYQCANKDTIEETGDKCHQDSAYSVEPIRNDFGTVVDYTCKNRVGSCRWRNCQCDRAFAHKIKQEVSFLCLRSSFSLFYEKSSYNKNFLIKDFSIKFCSINK